MAVVHAFTVFAEMQFLSFSEFHETLTRYMKENNVIFVRGASKRSSNRTLRYEWASSPLHDYFR
jgi:hypothetical protein